MRATRTDPDKAQLRQSAAYEDDELFIEDVFFATRDSHERERTVLTS